ncbi:MAG: hypothetical protein WDO13_04435 [Verrucomicrobiota bacterium]
MRIPGLFELAICGLDGLDALAGQPFTRVISISDTGVLPAHAGEGRAAPRLPRRKGPLLLFRRRRVPQGRGPARNEIMRILLFSLSFTPQDRVLIQCRAGISRSTALACAIVCQHLPIGQERKAVAHVRALRPQLLPNFLVIKLADELLERQGRLAAAVAAVREAF